MKKTLSLALVLTLVLSLAVPALAVEVVAVDDPVADGELLDFAVSAADQALGIMPISGDVPVEELAAPIPAHYVGDIRVDGVVVDLDGVPGAPAGYIPMRALCNAADAHVSWYAEDNEAFFQVCRSGVSVDLGDLSVKLDNEPVEGVTAYLDPAGYTFLPLTFLTTIPDFTVDDHPEMSSVHYDISTQPQRSPLEAVADAVAEAAGVGSTMELDMDTAADLGLTPENYVQAVVLFPLMSANASSVYVAEVAPDRMEGAKADFAAVKDFLMQSFGNYPACAEMIQAGQTVESPDGSHLLLVIAADPDAGAAVFRDAFPVRARG